LVATKFGTWHKTTRRTKRDQQLQQQHWQQQELQATDPMIKFTYAIAV
jgi:hypothetical protein